MTGSVAAIGVAAATVTMLGLVAPLAGVSIARHRAAAIADAAALAAASAAAGLVTDTPCAAAERIAATGGGALAWCEVDGLVVTVAVSIPMPVGEVSVYATAGPPAASSSGDRVPIRPGISSATGGADMV